MSRFPYVVLGCFILFFSSHSHGSFHSFHPQGNVSLAAEALYWKTFHDPIKEMPASWQSLDKPY
ncbi:MAG: hypothetical protein WB791_07165 [Waddliaceae bacterium]